MYPSLRCLSPVCEEQTAMSFPGSLVRQTVPTLDGDNASEEKKHAEDADNYRSHDSDPLRGALAWQADAAPWSGAAKLGAAAKTATQVEVVACNGT